MRGALALLLTITCGACQTAQASRDMIRVEENDPALVFSGDWTHADTSRRWSGGTASAANAAGASMSFSFAGSRVRWLGWRAPGAGTARVYLDGVAAGKIDLHSDAVAAREPVFTSEVLGAGIHTLTIEAAAGSTADAILMVDAFEVESYGGAFPPPLALRTPAAGAVVAGEIAVYAEAAAASGVIGVQFMLDGAALGGELTAPPYSITWNTTADGGDGAHVLTARARHADGSLSYAPTMTVTADNTMNNATNDGQCSANSGHGNSINHCASIIDNCFRRPL